jgi:hypothetical protein
MLCFPCPLTAAATEIFVSCLEISADLMIDMDPPEAWHDAYPLSAACFTPELARETLLDLGAKLRLPEEYVPTEYHWLLMYECLKSLIEVLNDDPLPSIVAQLVNPLLSGLAYAPYLVYGEIPEVCLSTHRLLSQDASATLTTFP